MRSLAHATRQDIKKSFVSRADIMYMLGIEKDAFQKLLKDPRCLIKKTKLHGKYTLKSVEREIKRLAG